VIAPRSLLCAAKQPPYRTWCTRGGGTNTANFSNSSNGESLIPVVPSDQARVGEVRPLGLTPWLRSQWYTVLGGR